MSDTRCWCRWSQGRTGESTGQQRSTTKYRKWTEMNKVVLSMSTTAPMSIEDRQRGHLQQVLLVAEKDTLHPSHRGRNMWPKLLMLTTTWMVQVEVRLFDQNCPYQPQSAVEVEKISLKSEFNCLPGTNWLWTRGQVMRMQICIAATLFTTTMDTWFAATCELYFDEQFMQ